MTLLGGAEVDVVTALRPAHLKVGSLIDGGLGYDALILGATYGAIAPDGDLYYDLSAVTLRNVEALSVRGPFGASPQPAVSVKVGAASLADVTFVTLYGNARLTTEEAGLDLTRKSITVSPGAAIESTSVGGTTFAVDSLSTAGADPRAGRPGLRSSSRA